MKEFIYITFSLHFLFVVFKNIFLQYFQQKFIFYIHSDQIHIFAFFRNTEWFQCDIWWWRRSTVSQYACACKHFLENVADEILQFWSPVLNPTNHGRRSPLHHVTQFGPDLFFCSGFSCYTLEASSGGGLVNAEDIFGGFQGKSQKHLQDSGANNIFRNLNFPPKPYNKEVFILISNIDI